jgi:hypothetical protein
VRGSNIRCYGTCETTLELPRPTLDLDAIEAVLRTRDTTEYEALVSKGWLRRVLDGVRGDDRLADLERQIDQPVPRVRRAATRLATGLAGPSQKVEAVTQLLQRRVRTSQPPKRPPRSLSETASTPSLTHTEGAMLGAALLRGMAVESRLLRARYAPEEEGVFCAWRHDGHWYGLPIWASGTVMIFDEQVEVWTDPEETRRVGWEVIGAYEQIVPRAGRLVLPVIAMGPQGDETGMDDPRPVAQPSCPGCGWANGADSGGVNAGRSATASGRSQALRRTRCQPRGPSQPSTCRSNEFARGDDVQAGARGVRARAEHVAIEQV